MKELFFVALLPDEQIQREITRFKQYAARHFGSRHALRSPPHITLFPPFRWLPDRLPEIEACLGRAAAAERPFELELNNFNCFPPRVIFVDVAPSEALQGLHRRLKERLGEELALAGDQRPTFNPHLTVAFKDLQRSLFSKAWEYFSAIEYQRRFRAEKLVLLEHHAQGWAVLAEFGFSAEG
jgi:2'-5' RNA ligase